MRELGGPWTHFFGPDQDEPGQLPEPTGSALLRDYLRAKGDEPYANLPTSVLRLTTGITLQLLVDADQPVLFEGAVILNERWPWNDGYPTTPQRSANWDAAYAAFQRGEQLALPFYEPYATDPDKRARLTSAYQDYRAGKLPPEQLPDLADIFPDDPVLRAEIGLQTMPDATPAQALIQACGACHNDVLDQTLSRARFNIALGRSTPAQRERAIERLQLPRTDPRAMPPLGARAVAPDSLSALIAYLQGEQRTQEDDELLEHAARRGMAPALTATSP
jgi:hypothetical protein